MQRDDDIDNDDYEKNDNDLMMMITIMLMMLTEACGSKRLCLSFINKVCICV